MSEQAQKLISIITERTVAIVNDSNTFLLAKCEIPYFNTREKVGGGNFLMALGAFSALSFLAKTYKLLKDGYAVIPDYDDRLLKSVLNQAKLNYPELGPIIDSLTPPRKGLPKVNETDAFVRLVLDFPDHLGFGDNPEEIKKVWKDYRDKLSHMATPNRPVSAFEIWKRLPFDEYLAKIDNNNNTPFQVDRLVIEFLVRDISRITKWLVDKIFNNEFTDENIKKLVGWLTN